MADNTVIPAGSGGDTISSDDIAGVKVQRVKVQHGADGAATDVSTASPLPVGDAGGSLTVDSADLAAIKAAVEILDNIVAGSEAQVDVLTLPALPAGTNNIGDVDVLSLPALPAGANNIGDVDVLTLPADPLGANADAAATAGSTGSLSAKLRLATSQLDAIKTATETMDNAVAGSELQVDVVGPLPAGTNNIGDVDVLTLPALAAGTNNIGDVDVLTQPVRAATTDTITAKLATDKIHDGITALTPKFAIVDAASSGDNTLLAAVASKKIRVLSVYLVAAAAVTVRFESGAGGTALSGQMNLAANGGFVLPFSPVGHFETASNTLLNLELSAAVSVDGGFTYVEVS